MALVDPAGSIISIAYLVEVMNRNLIGSGFLILLAVLAIFALWVWRNTTPQKQSKKKDSRTPNAKRQRPPNFPKTLLAPTHYR